MRRDRVIRFLVVGSVAGLALIACLAARYGLWSREAVAGVLLYGFLCELYIFLFTMTLSSISSNLLTLLLRGPMSDAEVSNVYDSRHMVEQRLQRLLGTGFLGRDGERLILTAKGARLLRMLRHFRAAFKHDAPIADR